MLVNVGEYLERLVAAVRPRKMLYLALDGVAPRAKMNQQRARRFCSAREAEEAAAAMAALRERSGGKAVESQKRWDHNAITPGTSFMAKLAAFVRAWAEAKVAANPALRVVVSDAATPGEGEHKIVDYIRRASACPGFQDERHAICGQDADLMFLALALHVPRVFLSVRRQHENISRWVLRVCVRRRVCTRLSSAETRREYVRNSRSSELYIKKRT